MKSEKVTKLEFWSVNINVQGKMREKLGNFSNEVLWQN